MEEEIKKETSIRRLRGNVTILCKLSDGLEHEPSHHPKRRIMNYEYREGRNR
jgi:hypothetical protein